MEQYINENVKQIVQVLKLLLSITLNWKYWEWCDIVGSVS